MPGVCPLTPWAAEAAFLEPTLYNVSRSGALHGPAQPCSLQTEHSLPPGRLSLHTHVP